MLLSVDNLTVGYGKRQVLTDVSLKVEEKSVSSIFGHNGAGKSTTVKTIMSIIKAWGGKVIFDGIDISAEEPWHNVRRGISYCPEANPVFSTLSVAENLQLAGRLIRKADASRYQDCQNRVFDLFPRLRDRLKMAAGSLSGGERQMLALGVALMNAPRLVLLDEPSAGLSPSMVGRLFSAIQEIKDKLGVGVLLVEQNVEDAAKLSDTIYVLHQGKIVFSGNQQEWFNNFNQKGGESVQV